MPPAKKKKFSRKELKKPDEFIAKSAEVSDVLTVHKRKILIGLGVVLGVAVIGAAVYIYLEEQTLRSSKGMVEALDLLSRPVETVQLFSGSSEGPDEESFASQREKDEATYEAFHAAVQKASTPSVRNMAILGEAQALLGLGRYEEAGKAYMRFIDSPEGAESFLFLAYEGLGLALEGQGELDGAQKQFQALQAVGDGKYEPLALYHQARLLESQDKKDEAKQMYARLAKRISDAPKMTPMLGYLQERIAGKEGVPASTRIGPPSGEPGMLMGPDGQVIPTPGSGGTGLSPEDIEKLKEALKKLEQEKAASGQEPEPAPPAGEEPVQTPAEEGEETQ